MRTSFSLSVACALTITTFMCFTFTARAGEILLAQVSTAFNDDLALLTQAQRDGIVFVLHQNGRTESHGAGKTVAAAIFNDYSPSGSVAYVPVEERKPGVGGEAGGEAVARSASSVVSPTDIRTFQHSGPYRRLFTNAGLSYIAGNVYLPCKAGKMIHNHEVGFIYFGGWGSSDSGHANGAALDAGFQHSSSFDGTDSDNYALFFAFKSHQLSVQPRLRCNQEVSFKFFPFTSSLLEATVSGYVVGSGDKTQLTALADTSHVDGWRPDGGNSADGVEVKRMVTIGQKNMKQLAGVKWDADGSYFGHGADNRTPLIKWSDVVVGYIRNGQPEGVRSFDATTTFRGNSSPWDYPNNSNKIIAKCPNGAQVCAEEADAIDLR